MYIYKDVVKFLLDYIDNHPKGQASKKNCVLEEEKQNFISNLFEEYSRVARSFLFNQWDGENKWGSGNFQSKLQGLNSFLVNGLPPILEEGENSGQGYIIYLIEELLHSNYSPPVDYDEIEDHLFALWVLFVMIPKAIPSIKLSSIFKKLELTTIKLIAQASMSLIEMKYKGKYFDHQFNRLAKIKRKKGKDQNEILIIHTYKAIQKDGKSKHRISTEIYNKLSVDLLKPPSLDTIKRRLKEAGLPPFD